MRIHKTVEIPSELYDQLFSLMDRGKIASHGLTFGLRGQRVTLSGQYESGSVSIDLDGVTASIGPDRIRLDPPLRLRVSFLDLAISSLSLLDEGIHVEIDRSFCDVKFTRQL